MKLTNIKVWQALYVSRLFAGCRVDWPRGPILGQLLGRIGLTIAVLLACAGSSLAEVSLPSIYSDNMVLQRGKPLTVWGWGTPGEQVEVQIGDSSATSSVSHSGVWSVTINSRPAAESTTFVVKGASNRIELSNVAVGDVWLCSGQSNMAWSVENAWDADLEIPIANHPKIRLLTIANHGAQFPCHTFRGKWEPCSPDSVREFSAVGYYFGRLLQERVGVPIGLIDNAWGGSTCEAWIPTELLESDQAYAPLMASWQRRLEEKSEEFAKYEAALTPACLAGKVPPRRPPWDGAITERHRPGNLFYGRLFPLLQTRLCGVIWYQGEANSRRSQQYQSLFPLMISAWREALREEELPFFWSQLPDYHSEGGPPRASAWAQLREAQTLALDQTSHTGQAVTIDLGEAGTIHPRDKRSVARRLARLALSEVYGLEIACRSPRLQSVEIVDNAVIVTLTDSEGGLCTVDAKQLLGFTLAGSDRQFYTAQAELLKDNRVRVTCDWVSKPVAVRYAWANNPICNLYTKEGLPVTPFRSDTWPGIDDQPY